jgi:cytochrome c biogenesis protein
MQAEKNIEVRSPGLIQTLSSVQFTVVVLVAITVVAMAGTIIPQGQSPEFYKERFNAFILFFIQVFRLDETYRSPLFLGLMGLFSLNLVFCTVKRFPGLLKTALSTPVEPDRNAIESMPIHGTLEGTTLEQAGAAFASNGFPLKSAGKGRLFGEMGNMGYFGSTIVHLGLMVILAGGVASLITGKRGMVALEEGQSTSLAVMANDKKIPLGFTVALDSFRVAFYENYRDRPKSFTSSVKVTLENGHTFNRDIRVNHPLMLNGFTLFQSSYGVSDKSGLGAEGSTGGNDTAKVEIRLKGSPPNMPPIAAVDMTPGGVYPIPGFGDSISVRLAELHRSFSMGGPENAPNPAVKLDVLVHGQTRWSVYAFKNYPGLNMPVHPDINFTFAMLDIRAGGPSSAANAGARYYTVLGAVRDRGIPLVWTGAILLMAGLLISFFVRPRRIRVVEENGKVYVGAWIKGDSKEFKDFFESVMKRAGNSKDIG